MNAATLTIALILDDEWAPPAIATRAFVLVEEAARLHDRTYTTGEAQRVTRTFDEAYARLTTAGSPS